MYSDKSEISVKNYVFEIIRALIAALIITLAAVLVAALAIKFFNVPTSAITIINAAIKGVSVFVSALIFLRLPNSGYLRGIILGVLYIALSYVVFSLFNGEFKFGINILNDFAFGAVAKASRILYNILINLFIFGGFYYETHSGCCEIDHLQR